MGMRHDDIPPELDSLAERVIGAAIEVHRTLGAGLLERSYEIAVAHELSLRSIPFERQVEIRPVYKGVPLAAQHLDLVVEGRLVLELKAVEKVADAHLAQLVGYLKAGGFPLGLLINFNTPVLHQSVYRRVNTTESSPPRLRAPSAPPRT